MSIELPVGIFVAIIDYSEPLVRIYETWLTLKSDPAVSGV